MPIIQQIERGLSRAMSSMFERRHIDAHVRGPFNYFGWWLDWKVVPTSSVRGFNALEAPQQGIDSK